MRLFLRVSTLEQENDFLLRSSSSNQFGTDMNF